MRPSSSWPPPLPAAVGAELARLEARLGQTADPSVRAKLAELGDAAAARVLATVAASGDRVRTLSGFIVHLAKQEAMERNAAGIPTAESAALGSGPFHADDLAAEPDGMEVESPHRCISPGRLQNQSCFSPPVASPVSNRGTTQAGCHGYEYEMRGALARDHTPSPVRDITRRVELLDVPSGRVVAATEFSPTTGNASRATEASEPSPQMIALGELEFVRIFLIFVYLAGKKIEEVVEDVNYIRYLKSLPMDCFEPEIWNKFGHESLPASERRKVISPWTLLLTDSRIQLFSSGTICACKLFRLLKFLMELFADSYLQNLDWDPSKTRLYYCIVEKRHDSIVTIFKGPYIDNTRTHLQKVVGDDNVLIVKFADIPEIENNADKFGIYCMHYHQIVEDGILLGLRQYRFFLKGTLLADKRVCSINLHGWTFNGLAGVKAEYFIELLGKALEDANKTRTKARDSLEARLMILSGSEPSSTGWGESESRELSGKEIVGNSKYAIFFPTSGERSLADEMANSDFDGDMYWVSWNPQLVEPFEPGTPWEHKSQPKNTKQKKPQDYDGPELERLLFCEFLRARFSPSYVLGTAANCWLARMDRLLTPGVSQREKDRLKNHMLELVDIYYWALDAPKNGTKVISNHGLRSMFYISIILFCKFPHATTTSNWLNLVSLVTDYYQRILMNLLITIPQRLMVEKYPHFLEREPSYIATSLLGWIYDKAKSQQSETVLAISVLLACLYVHYEAEEFEASPRSKLDLFSDACAIYQVVYEHAAPRNEVSKCGFAWKVAGRMLCELYFLKHGGETVTCLRSVLEDAFKKYRA
ncbi:hypothetical protein HU200_055878 [Digitaria exilis]|uniref:RNA-dependent RNA polymerase n=1 Tax=Digitaria exilis TaxID=1010633 RepID=A0A835AE21_9POAL|nr:hypothetical protein HU200_055878 [Digitaria exilis]